jgi:uncharacterized protein
MSGAGDSVLGGSSNDRFVCVVLHDVATSTRAACQRTLNAIRQVGELPVTLLAVPRYHGETPAKDFVAWLGQRARGGDEIALHGWTHRDELPAGGLTDRLRRNHYTRGEGEFSALGEAEAESRIELGLAWFREHGWTAHGFVAPAWLLGEGAWRALDGRGFEYTATLRELVHLPGKARIASQSVVYSTSSAWRRQSSLVWNRVVSLMERRNRLLRIELHPRDADFAGVRASWQKILEKALRDRRAVTLAEFMRQSRTRDDTGIATTVALSTEGPSTWQATTADRN